MQFSRDRNFKWKKCVQIFGRVTKYQILPSKHKCYFSLRFMFVCLLLLLVLGFGFVFHATNGSKFTTIIIAISQPCRLYQDKTQRENPKHSLKNKRGAKLDNVQTNTNSHTSKLSHNLLKTGVQPRHFQRYQRTILFETKSKIDSLFILTYVYKTIG